MSIDYTFVVQIALFVALWVVLKRLWFDPALRVIRERTARSEGAVREARAIQTEAERLRAEHAAALDQAKGEALQAGPRARAEAEALRATLARDVENLPALRSQLRADLRATAERECEALLALGRTAAERIRTDARLLAEHEFAAARAALRAEVIEEAVRQATALIRQAIRPEDQEQFVREFVAGAGAPA